MPVGGETQIRPVLSGDIDSVVALENTVFSNDRFARRQFRWLMTRANAQFLVAESNRNIAGYVIGLYRRNSRICRCYGLAVAPTLRGAGLAQKLMEHLTTDATRRGCTAISLEVRCDNQRAIRFYQRLGFRQSQHLGGYYDEGVDGLRMRKAV